MENILEHPKLEKYSVWLATGKIIPEAGQISPAIAHSGLAPII
ncbi:TPA: C protein [Providencia rettgeri]|nr:C protein [Providencia rettgeri]HEC8329170.1 C protein [Providencia rettgeri]HEM7185917.1 C protein [Providencia rettgeri]